MDIRDQELFNGARTHTFPTPAEIVTAPTEMTSPVDVVSTPTEVVTTTAEVTTPAEVAETNVSPAKRQPKTSSKASRKTYAQSRAGELKTSLLKQVSGYKRFRCKICRCTWHGIQLS